MPEVENIKSHRELGKKQSITGQRYTNIKVRASEISKHKRSLERLRFEM